MLVQQLMYKVLDQRNVILNIKEIQNRQCLDLDGEILKKLVDGLLRKFDYGKDTTEYETYSTRNI